MTRWTWADDYSHAYAETSDPRVLAVIERDEHRPKGPDGDALAPAYWIEYRGEWRSGNNAGSTFDDEEAVSAYIEARNRAPYLAGRPIIDSHEFAERYMRIFRNTAVEMVRNQGDIVLLLNTPAFRAHIGIDTPTGRALNGAGQPIADSIAYSLEGERVEFQAWLDGDVFGVGYAVNAGRVLDDSPVEFDDYDVSIECWGFYGEEYAKDAALDSGYGWPNLPTMLPIPEGVTA